MVQANPQPQPSRGASMRARPIPIGEDHLQFKHDPQIQGQLDHNGKSTTTTSALCTVNKKNMAWRTPILSQNWLMCAHGFLERRLAKDAEILQEKHPSF